MDERTSMKREGWMKPRIAIPLPTSGDLEYNRLNWPSFAEAVAASGGDPVEVRLDLSDGALLELAAGCDGVVLPGSPADVNPELYGQVADYATAAADAARERTDRILLEEAKRRGEPVLGVCFGTQMINVWRGGTLVQDLTVMPVNHAAARGVMVAHTATLEEGSELAALAGERRVEVNSSHHQAIGIAGSGLRVVARCPQDGVVEAVESVGGGQFLVGVQWHPERTFAVSGVSRRLFGELVRCASVLRG